MYATITTWPPLGQTTVIEERCEAVQFKVLLTTSLGATEDVDVRVWHNHSGLQDWSETCLGKDGEGDIFSDSKGQPKHRKTWYHGTLPTVNKGRSTSFTVKFRTAGNTGWRWIRDQSGISDGQILFVTTPETSEIGLDTILEGWEAKPLRISSGTPVRMIYFRVEAAEGDHPGRLYYPLGRPSKAARWFALVRLWAPWLAPRQGSGKFYLDKDAILVSFLQPDGRHAVFLAISGINDVTTTFQDDPDGNLVICARNDRETPGEAVVVLAVAGSFEEAKSEAMYVARRMVESRSERPSQETYVLESPEPPESQWFEEWYDGFTFCTWNALGQDLSEDKISNALKDLKDRGIKIENLIIDDGWQSVSKGPTQFDRGWISFEADKKRFPNGLKAAISKIRSDHPNIKHVAVWHALMGYWGCISPDGEVANQYETETVDFDFTQVQGSRTVVAGSDIARMYDDFYRFLSDCGIDSVKTDAQFFIDTLRHSGPRRRIIKEYQDAWAIAHLRHMSARSISCMSQSPSIMFHSQLPTNRPSIPLRNSDDFFPDVEDSHPWHIFCNAHNSLFTQHLNVVPDWDMFQTDHPWGSFHAAARCVSGGPIYFTDTPGHHNMKLINQMTAITPEDGKRVVLRTHTVGKTINAYTGYKDPALVKIGTYVGYAKTGTAIIGVFNCLEYAHAEVLRLSDFPGAEPDCEYIIRSFDGTVSKPMTHTLNDNAYVHVSLERRGWSILSAHPTHTFGNTKVALIGLVGHMVGIAGVLGYSFHAEPSGRMRLWANLKAIGKLGLWISNLADKNIDDHIMVMLGGFPVGREVVAVSSQSKQVLEIDYAKLWEEDRTGPKTYTWGNEVSLEVFISP